MKIPNQMALSAMMIFCPSNLFNVKVVLSQWVGRRELLELIAMVKMLSKVATEMNTMFVKIQPYIL
jgi:hypothetical protein